MRRSMLGTPAARYAHDGCFDESMITRDPDTSAIDR